MIRGKIASVEDHGSIIITWIDVGDIDGVPGAVYWDRRQFATFLADNPKPIGIEVETDGESVRVL